MPLTTYKTIELSLSNEFNFSCMFQKYTPYQFENKLITEKITKYRNAPEVITYIQEMIDKEKINKRD